MEYVDPAGKQWSHHLRVESSVNTSASGVAEYFLSYLTLDDIDETGKAPSVPFVAFAEGTFTNVYWDRDFTFKEVKTMCETTLPNQLVGLEVEEEQVVIGPVWYDGVAVPWVPQLEE